MAPKIEIHDARSSIVMNTFGFGDPHMVEWMSLSSQYDGRGKGNFDHVDFLLMNEETGYNEWGAITKFQKLSSADFAYLRSIQPDDFNQWGYTINQKMGWLYQDKGRPYFPAGGVPYTFGTMIFGHSRVRVRCDHNGEPIVKAFTVKFPSPFHEKPRWAEFVEIDGFRRWMMGRPVDWLLNNAYIQICTESQLTPEDPDRISSTSKGIKYHPVWDFRDWPGNQKGKYYIWKEALYK